MFGNTSSDFLLRLFLTIAIFGVEALQLAGQVVPVHPGSAEGAPGKNGITLQPFNFCPKCRGWSPRGMPEDWVDRNPFLLKSWGTYQSKISLTESKRIPNLKSENWTAWTIFKKIGFPKHGIVFQTFFHIFPYFSRIFPEFFQNFSRFFLTMAIYGRSDSCQGSVEENLTVRRGFLELMDTMPQAENRGRVFFFDWGKFLLMFVYLGKWCTNFNGLV